MCLLSQPPHVFFFIAKLPTPSILQPLSARYKPAWARCRDRMHYFYHEHMCKQIFGTSERYHRSQNTGLPSGDLMHLHTLQQPLTLKIWRPVSGLAIRAVHHWLQQATPTLYSFVCIWHSEIKPIKVLATGQAYRLRYFSEISSSV